MSEISETGSGKNGVRCWFLMRAHLSRRRNEAACVGSWRFVYVGVFRGGLVLGCIKIFVGEGLRTRIDLGAVMRGGCPCPVVGALVFPLTLVCFVFLFLCA